MPAKFRDELGGRCVVAKSLDECLTIYPAGCNGRKLVVDKLDEPSQQVIRRTRKVKRHYFSSAAECDVDKQGRLTIPQELKDYAGIDKDLVTIGKQQDYRSLEQGVLGC